MPTCWKSSAKSIAASISDSSFKPNRCSAFRFVAAPANSSAPLSLSTRPVAIFLLTTKKERNEKSQAALKKEFALLKEAGVKGLYYLVGDHLLGDDNEGTVDSSHPTDLGFFRQADAFEPVLREILK